MKNKILIYTSSCLLFVFFFVSCHSTKHTVAKKPVAHKSSSKQPQFIDNVYMDRHNKTNATSNAVSTKKGRNKSNIDPLVTKTPATANTVIEDNQERDPIVVTRTFTNAEKKSISRKYADILNVKPKDVDNLALYTFIDKWYGTTYRLGGHDRSGIDCSGFAQKLYDEVYGIDLLRTAVEQFGNCTRVKKLKDAKEGDLVFFHHVHGKHITHVGIYLANDYFVHASTSNGVMISNLNEEYWQKSFAGVGRIPTGDK